MQMLHSSKARKGATDARIASLLKTVFKTQLREWVERIAVPRHFVAEAAQNRATAKWLDSLFQFWGYRVERQGCYSNVIDSFPSWAAAAMRLLGK